MKCKLILSFKLAVITALILICMVGAYISGRNSNSAETQILTTKIEGQDYIVGSVVDGVQTIDQMAIFALLLANAEDPGIVRTAVALGFRGPMSIQEIQARQQEAQNAPDAP